MTPNLSATVLRWHVRASLVISSCPRLGSLRSRAHAQRGGTRDVPSARGKRGQRSVIPMPDRPTQEALPIQYDREFRLVG